MKIPEWKIVKLYFGYGILLYLQFFVVYGATNWFASESSDLHQLSFSWEQCIPLVPLFIIPYLSLILFIILPVFYLALGRVLPWAKSYMLMVFFAGGIFFIMPTENAIIRTGVTGDFSYLFSLLYALDLPYNLFPSLHVALSTLAFLIIRQHFENRLIFTGIALWWGLMTLSVILVHQHNMADIAGGFLLAWLSYRYIYCGDKEHA